MAGKPTNVCVLLNTAAAGFEDRPVREICDVISSTFAAHGITADVHLAFGGTLQQRAMREIEEGKGDAIVVGGGDGTASAAAGAVAGTGIPMGILPLGRFNHFARD